MDLINVSVTVTKILLENNFPSDIIKYILHLSFKEELDLREKLYNHIIKKKNYPENMCHRCYKDWICRYWCYFCGKKLCPDCYIFCQKCQQGMCLKCKEESHEKVCFKLLGRI